MTPTATPHSPPAGAAIDPRWSKLPQILAVAGLVLALLGAFVNTRQLAHSYLLAFMFFLSLCLGGLFLTLLHHIFDANWSVPTRRSPSTSPTSRPCLACSSSPSRSRRRRFTRG